MLLRRGIGIGVGLLVLLASISVAVAQGRIPLPCVIDWALCQQADMSQEIIAPKTTIEVGETLTVTWVIKNEGNANVQFFGEPVVSGELNTAIFAEPVGDNVSFNDRTFAVGESYAIEVVVGSPVAGSYPIEAIILPSLPDPFPLNDDAGLVIEIVDQTEKVWLPLLSN